jgi:signal-transduction protein with cAMP-binding, CBS, and nucleotidyltransferase domain
MLGNRMTGAVVFQGNKAVGIFTDRALLRRFAPLDRKPSDVKVSEVMAPILRIDKNASTVDAAKKLLNTAFTRLCVFEGDKFVGWVTLTDLARNTTRKGLLKAIANHYAPEEVLCPVCKVGVMEMYADSSGTVVRWDCTNCGYSE